MPRARGYGRRPRRKRRRMGYARRGRVTYRIGKRVLGGHKYRPNKLAQQETKYADGSFTIAGAAVVNQAVGYDATTPTPPYGYSTNLTWDGGAEQPFQISRGDGFNQRISHRIWAKSLTMKGDLIYKHEATTVLTPPKRCRLVIVADLANAGKNADLLWSDFTTVNTTVPEARRVDAFRNLDSKRYRVLADRVFNFSRDTTNIGMTAVGDVKMNYLRIPFSVHVPLNHVITYDSNSTDGSQTTIQDFCVWGMVCAGPDDLGNHHSSAIGDATAQQNWAVTCQGVYRVYWSG